MSTNDEQVPTAVCRICQVDVPAGVPVGQHRTLPFRPVEQRRHPAAGAH